ncbi:hypothetical protein ACVIJ6_006809 [Bradyrhizobium sp. USDA 4369]
MICNLDHLSIIAPTLAEGVKHVRESLDVDIPFGRKHDYMGTHNHLLSLGGGIYLEVIAVDPHASAPVLPRWFGLDDSGSVREAWDRGQRLRGWVANTRNIDQHLEKYGSLLGEKRCLFAGGSEFFFSVPCDGSLPMGGAAPSLIDRRGREPSIPPTAQLGCKLISVRLEHPQVEVLGSLFADLGVNDAVDLAPAECFRMALVVDTPSGRRSLC